MKHEKSIIKLILLFLIMMLIGDSTVYASSFNSNKTCLDVNPSPLNIASEAENATLTATLRDCVSNMPLYDKDLIWRNFDDSTVQPLRSITDSNGMASTTYKINLSNYFGKIQVEFLGDKQYSKSQAEVEIGVLFEVYKNHFLERPDYKNAMIRYSPNYFNELYDDKIVKDFRESVRLFYRSSQLNVYIENKGEKAIPSNNIDIVKSAFSEWEKATKDFPYEVKFEFVSDPSQAQIIIVKEDKFEGLPIGVQGLAGHEISNGFLIKRISLLPSSSGNKRTIMHEIGHTLGIEWHPKDLDSIMSQNEEYREITTKDVNTLMVLYSIHWSSVKSTIHP